MRTHTRHFGITVFSCSLIAGAAFASEFTVHLQKRGEGGATQEETQKWKGEETAIIICDMWNQHWCKSATARVAEMAPHMNEVLKAARARGITIVHAPSETMKFYKDHPARLRALAIVADPEVEKKMAGKGWSGGLPTEKGHRMPGNTAHGGCDDDPVCPGKPYPWTRQIATLEIDDALDLITDDGVAVGTWFTQKGIKNVILVGVHTNMCVIGRPFGLRKMVTLGMNTVLMRDMTDAMTRHTADTDHFQSLEKIIGHIESYVTPTVTSVDFVGKPFAFKRDASK